MHTIEPHYNWRNYYVAAEDERSPFFGREYSEFEFRNKIYDHLLHPEWDDFESPTLFIKILYVNYDSGYAILEFIGEWNDCLNNDIMHLKRNIIEELVGEGISKFILLAENVLIFHSSDDCYYEEWFDEVEDGWIAGINFQEHVQNEMKLFNVDNYMNISGSLQIEKWRTLKPNVFFELVNGLIQHRLAI